MLDIPATLEESEALVAETAATMTLESEYAAALDFGGINTSVVSCKAHSCLAKVLWHTSMASAVLTPHIEWTARRWGHKLLSRTSGHLVISSLYCFARCQLTSRSRAPRT